MSFAPDKMHANGQTNKGNYKESKRGRKTQGIFNATRLWLNKQENTLRKIIEAYCCENQSDDSRQYVETHA